MKRVSQLGLGFLFCFVLFSFVFFSAKCSDLDVVSQKRNEVKSKENDERRKNTEIERIYDEGIYRKNGFAAVSKAILKIGKAVEPEMATITNNSMSAMDAISRCCKKYPEACDANKRVVEHQGQIQNTADLIQNIQLEAQNLQKWTESTQNKFSVMIIELSKIIEDSEMVMKSVSPETMDQMNKKTSEVKKTVEKKIKSGKKVEYDEINIMLSQAYKSVISSTTKIFNILLESIPKVIEFATDRVANRRAKKLEDLGTSDPNQSLESRGWLVKNRKQIFHDLAIIKKNLQAEYFKATKTLNEVSKNVDILHNFLSTGNKLYRKVKSARSCCQKRNYVLDAAAELNKALPLMQNVLAEVRTSKRIIEQAWALMKSHLTSKPLGNDLSHINQMLKDISMTNPKIDLMSVQIEHFLKMTNDKNTPEEMTYNAVEDLTTIIRQTDVTINCYITKMQLINYVITECSKGIADISHLYDQGVAMLDIDASQCERGMGIVHISKSAIKNNLPKIAKVKKFNPNCVLNSKMKKEYCCQLYSSGFSVEDVAKKTNLSPEDVKQMIANCPKQGMPPKMIAVICKLRKMMTNEKIAKILKLDVNDVKEVKC
ncbi:uncharacterized protein LOC116307657 [Actinia tenebrosa]|uniref:Uncharacterized protein LOC116307657 n=1 Tax=Actinia tenebrosa TaxID=6105 RepID=A0A6P8J1L3_ACTTE|nr:uncharacterized protein LOC116307657 [Actinia tenebrosa]